MNEGKCPSRRDGVCLWPSRCGPICAAFLCLGRTSYKDRPPPEVTPPHKVRSAQ